jgi:hypothetical protein
VTLHKTASFQVSVPIILPFETKEPMQCDVYILDAQIWLFGCVKYYSRPRTEDSRHVQHSVQVVMCAIRNTGWTIAVRVE